MKSPVKKEHITQAFGENPASYAKFGLKGHNGIDFRAFLPNGDRCYAGGQSEVFCPHDGVIKENALDANGYGNYVKIENDNEGSILGHFSSLSALKVGTQVKEGQFLAFQGTTGNSSGIHLHFGYYKKPRNRQNGFDGFIDQKGLYQPFVTNQTMPDELQKVLDHYNVKTADELILMVDKELGFLKSGRETILKLEATIKSQKNDLEALQLVKDSLSIKLSGVEAEKDNAKQMFRDLIDKMALTVGTVADEGAIIKKITSDVTELDLAQKEVKKVTEELNKYRNEKETEILNLKREIGELRADLYKKDIQLTNLSKRIDDLEKLPPVTPKESLLDRIKKEIEVILSIIRKA